MSGMAIDGLVSGLSTSSLISQLMQVDGLQQAALKTKVAKEGIAKAAYQAVATKVQALQTAATALGDAATWRTTKVTSSSDAVVASTSADATTGSFTFSVDRLASAHSLVSKGAATSLDAVVATSYPIEVRKADGTVATISPSSGSMADVVRAINSAADAGVKAAAVQVSPGQYRLQITATETGAGAFTVTGLDGLGGGFDVASTGQDAQLTVGSGTGAYTVTSRSNTFADVLPGVTFTARATTAAGAPATLSVERDDAAITAGVKTMVEAANAVLTEIAAKSSSDPLAPGPLAGDSTLRSLAQSILGSVSDRLSGTSLSAVGIELTRGGRLELDEAALTAALADDADAVEAAFRSGPVLTPAAGATGKVLLLAGGDAEGSREVVVTQAATRAKAVAGSVAGGNVLGGSTLTLAFGGEEVAVTATGGLGGESLTSVATRLSAAATAAGMAVDVAFNTTTRKIDVTARDYGSATSLDLRTSGTFTDDGTTAGRDVAGTVGGQPATGRGRTLTAADGTALRVDLTAAELAAVGGGRVATLAFSPSFAQRVDALAAGAVDADTGRLSLAVKGRERTVSRLEDQIESWDRRLELRKAALQKQFSGLEVALQKLQSQSQWLSGQIAGLSTSSSA